MQPRVILVADNLILLSRVAAQLAQEKYTVSNLRDVSELPAKARELQPLFIILDLTVKRGDPCGAITQLKTDDALKHVPVLAFGDHKSPLLATAREAGADAVTTNGAITQHLPQLIQQLLTV